MDKIDVTHSHVQYEDLKISKNSNQEPILNGQHIPNDVNKDDVSNTTKISPTHSSKVLTENVEELSIFDSRNCSHFVNFGASLQDSFAMHAVHILLWSDWDDLVIHDIRPTAAIIMQMRFDGHFGFPGGMVDEPLSGFEESQAKLAIVNALKRELIEEMNMCMEKHPITVEDYKFTHRHPTKNLYLHFFCYKMTIEDIVKLEFDALKSQEFGKEVLGLVRVPLYTMRDGYRGLPAFLNNTFIGTAKEQLLCSLEFLKIMSRANIETALTSSKKFK